MALRVWLPLNGDLKNKGISDITVTNNGATVDNNGKIGKCYSFNGNYIKTDYLNYPNIFSGDFSICFWVYSTTNKARDIYFANYGLSGSGNWFNLERDANNYLRFWWNNGSPDYHNSNFIINQNEWTHISIIKSENTLIFYKNGNLINSYTITLSTAIPLTATTFYLGADYRTGQSIDLYGKMNDFRLYDHCLSTKEVKEISQGLVLHYKLDGFNGGAGENLAIGTNTADISTNVFNQSNQTGGVTKEIVYDNDIPCVKITRNNTAQSGWKFFSYNNFLRNNIKTSTQYTVSFDIKASVNGTIGFTGLVQGNATNYMTKSTSVEQGVVTQNVWSHIILHCTTKDSFSDITIGSQVIYMSPSASLVDIGVSYLLKNMKLEEGESATSWTPSLSEMGIDTSKIIDSSGYGRDGIQNNITIITESDRYNNSTNFNGTDSYVKIPDNSWMSQGMEALTVNLWAKATTWSTNGGRLLSCTETGGFNLEGGNSGYWRFPTHVYTNAEKTSTAYKYDSKEIQISALTPNDWNMITLVYDTTGTKTYINGQLHHTYTNTSYGIHFNTNARLFLGCEANTASPGGNYFNGQESDFRLYVTALSAEDILDLYHTPANVDNLGEIHGFEFIEDGGNSISKNGVIHNGNISQFLEMSYLKYDPNIYFEPDGSAWVHIYHHNHPDLASFSSTDTFTASVYKDENRWFNATEICNQLDKWEFLIKYKYETTSTELKERWVQTKNPENAVFGDVDAADIVRNTSTGYRNFTWGGLYKKNGSAYWVLNNGNNGNWWGATGSFSIYQGGIPGYGGTITKTGYNDLYVRIDNVSFNNLSNAKITANNLYMGRDIIEK